MVFEMLRRMGEYRITYCAVLAKRLSADIATNIMPSCTLSLSIFGPAICSRHLRSGEAFLRSLDDKLLQTERRCSLMS